MQNKSSAAVAGAPQGRRPSPVRVRLVRLALGLAGVLAASACGTGSGGEGGGNPTFSKSFGADASDAASAGVGTPDGGYVFVGSYNGRERSGAIVDEDLWVSKLDTFGDIEWSRVYSQRQPSTGNLEREVSYHLTCTSENGGHFLVGTVDQVVERDEANVSPTDLVVTYLDADGDQVWTQEVGALGLPLYPLFDANGTPGEFATVVQPMADGGLVLGALVYAPVRIDGRSVRLSAPWLCRIDSVGSVLWSRFVEEELYTIFGYNNSGIHLDRTNDDGLVVALPMVVESDGFDLAPAEDITRLLRLDADGTTVWSQRAEGFSAMDVDFYVRPQTGREEVLVAAESYDALTPDDRELHVFVADTGLDIHRQDLDALDQVHEALAFEVSDGRLFYCAVGRWGDSDRVGVELYEVGSSGGTQEVARLEIPAATSFLDLRSFEEAFTGFELILGTAPDARGAGQMLNYRIDLTGAVIRSNVFNRTVPGQVNPYFREGREHAGWIGDTDDHWLWTPTTFEEFDPSMTLSVYDLTGGQFWSSTFAPATDRRLERALQVEVVEGPSPEEFTLAVLGELAFEPFVDPPSPDEPLSAWVLRLDAAGQVLSQVALETVTLATSDQRYSVTESESLAPQYRRSRSVMTVLEGGDVLVGGDSGGLPRVTRVDAAGNVVWVSRPLTDGASGDLLALAPTADGGSVALGAGWVTRLDPAGEPVWYDAISGADGGGVCELTGGEILVFTSRRGVPHVIGLDAAGVQLWARTFDPDLAPLYDQISPMGATPDGGAVFAVSRLSDAALRSGDPATSVAWDVQLVKVASDGTFAWIQTLGALLEEAVGDLAVLPDGGVLVTARSDSLGVGSEAWLVRTDSCGRVISGCRAQLERLEAEPEEGGELGADSALVLVQATTPSFAAGVDVPGGATAWGTNASVTTVTEDVVVARQCSGRSKDDPNAGQTATLTVVIGGGLGTVAEDVVSDPRIDCPTVCEVELPLGTTLTLRGTPAAGFTTPVWTGGDCGSGPRERCAVTMDGDRTVAVVFPDEVYTGLADLTVLFAGSGSGSVLVNPPGLTVTEDMTIVDLASSGDVITLQATPSAGSSFGGWTGVDSADGTFAQVIFGTSDRTVTVRFD